MNFPNPTFVLFLVLIESEVKCGNFFSIVVLFQLVGFVVLTGALADVTFKFLTTLKIPTLHILHLV